MASGFAHRRSREWLEHLDMPTYVIGDVHGRYDLLSALERKIFADAAGLPGRKLIIMLGDFIDRGPASAQVVGRLMASPPNGFDRICLTGNNEMAMLACSGGEISLAAWVARGGDATSDSSPILTARYRSMIGWRSAAMQRSRPMGWISRN